LFSQLFLHAVEGLLLSLLGDTALEALTLNAFLKELDLILIVGFDGVYHQFVLDLLLHLSFLVLTFLLKKLVLFQLASQLIDLLTEEDLLSVSLVIKRLLVREELFLEFLLTDSLNAGLSLQTFLYLSVLFTLFKFFGLDFKLVLTIEGLELLLLPEDTSIGFFGVDAVTTWVRVCDGYLT
jgi:hypothetical protein